MFGFLRKQAQSASPDVGMLESIGQMVQGCAAAEKWYFFWTSLGEPEKAERALVVSKALERVACSALDEIILNTEKAVREIVRAGGDAIELTEGIKSLHDMRHDVFTMRGHPLPTVENPKQTRAAFEPASAFAKSYGFSEICKCGTRRVFNRAAMQWRCPACGL